jgi:hypothetical protein
VTHGDYHRALEAALREYEELGKKRAEIDERMAQLAQTIGSLTRLCGLTPTVPWGLTEACRMVLKQAGHPLTAAEVRSQLEAMGVDLSRYANALAAIHTTLHRLAGGGDVQFAPRVHGKPAYRWAQPVRTVVLSKEAAQALFEDAPQPPLSTSSRSRRKS